MDLSQWFGIFFCKIMVRILVKKLFLPLGETAWKIGLQQYTGISVYITIRNPHIELRYDFYHTGTKILQKFIHISSRKAIRNNDTLYQDKQNKLVLTVEKNKLLRKNSILKSLLYGVQLLHGRPQDLLLHVILLN